MKPKDPTKPAPAQGSSTQVAPTATTTASAPQRPIIIVPNAATSEININNIVSYLQDGLYVNPKDAAKNKQKVAVVQRPNPANPQQMLQYKIIDDAVSLSADDWNRVVAVFVTGQTWQFKNWKYQEPVNLFQHVLGVHLVSETKTVAPIITTWNCKVLKVSRLHNYV